MANVIKLGSMLLNGTHTQPGSEYKPGQSICFADGDTLSWIVINGLLIADRPVLVNISWDHLNDQKLVFGKQVTINGLQFSCRLLRVGAEECVPNEWDAALDAVGEDDALWHWNGIFFWGQESVSGLASHRALRGCHSARRYYWDSSYHWNVFVGFRPALVSLPSDNLAAGDRICAIGSQTILYGKLVDLTRYDAIIQPEPTSMMADADAGKCYSKLPDGMVALDRTCMVMQTVKEM